MLAAIAAVTGAWDKVRLVIRDSIVDEPSAQRTAWTLWLEYYGAAAYDGMIAARVNTTRTAWRSTLTDIIQYGQRDGDFQTTRSASECASVLFALIDGFGIRLAATGPSVDATEIVATIESVAAQLLQPSK